jgi:hypothetical protein
MCDETSTLSLVCSFLSGCANGATSLHAVQRLPKISLFSAPACRRRPPGWPAAHALGQSLCLVIERILHYR